MKVICSTDYVNIFALLNCPVHGGLSTLGHVTVGGKGQRERQKLQMASKGEAGCCCGSDSGAPPSNVIQENLVNLKSMEPKNTDFEINTPTIICIYANTRDLVHPELICFNFLYFCKHFYMSLCKVQSAR